MHENIVLYSLAIAHEKLQTSFVQLPEQAEMNMQQKKSKWNFSSLIILRSSLLYITALVMMKIKIAGARK